MALAPPSSPRGILPIRAPGSVAGWPGKDGPLSGPCCQSRAAISPGLPISRGGEGAFRPKVYALSRWQDSGARPDVWALHC